MTSVFRRSTKYRRSYAATVANPGIHHQISFEPVEAYMELKTILCGVDFSDRSVDVFKAAVELVRLSGADLLLVHVIESNPVPRSVLPFKTLDDEIMSVEKKAMQALEKLIGEWAADLQAHQVRAEVTTGQAATELVNYARDQKVDLTVIGAKGFRLLEEAVVGGTTARVVKEAACSVLVVRN